MTASLVDPDGPLVVSKGRWGLPNGARGALDAPGAVWAARLGIPVVFVLGEALLSHVDPSHKVERTDKNGDGVPWRIKVKTTTGDRVTLVDVAADQGAAAGPWQGLDGGELCQVFAHLQRLLGVTWAGSTGKTAEELILSTHPRRRGGRRMDTVPSIPEPCESAALEQPWQSWSRPLTDYEGTAEWVHTFDANAAFLGPWQTVTLGFGKAKRCATSSAAARCVGKPGVWWVELPAGWSEVHPLDGTTLPPIAPRLQLDQRTKRLCGWVMTPTLGRLQEWAEAQGWAEVIPEHGWCWDQQSRFLESAGVKLRDARASSAVAVSSAAAILRESQAVDDPAVDGALARLVVADAVREAVADLYRVAVGRMASQVPAPWWRRPDWSNLIRAQYRTSLHRKMARWGTSPFAVATDALAFATDEPDPQVFADSIGLRTGVGLGEFKHQGTCRRELVAEHLDGGARGVLAVFQTAAGKVPAAAGKGT